LPLLEEQLPLAIPAGDSELQFRRAIKGFAVRRFSANVYGGVFIGVSSSWNGDIIRMQL